MRIFDEFVETIAVLRGENGCPWDIKQTHQSLKKHLLEESGEVIEAIDSGDDENLCEELGDVLLQVVLHAQIAAEEGRFTIEDVCRVVNDKMIRRHPHVFGDVVIESEEDQLRLWEEIKKQEKEK